MSFWGPSSQQNTSVTSLATSGARVVPSIRSTVWGHGNHLDKKTNEHQPQVGPWAEWAGDKDRETCDCGHLDSVPAPKQAVATHPQLHEEMWVQC